MLVRRLILTMLAVLMGKTGGQVERVVVMVPG